MTQPHSPQAQEAPRCYRHPDRETWIRCQRCEKPICPDCMNDASVGFQCPDCLRAGAKQTRQGQSAYGGSRSADPRITTYVLIALNVAVFVLIQAVPRLVNLFAQTGYDRCVLPSGATFGFPGGGAAAQCAANGGHYFHGLLDGGLWMPLSSMFAHQAIWHIAGNMIALYFLGPAVERVFGRARFLAIYFVAGLSGGALAFSVMDAQAMVLGASGAIWGLMAALLLVARRIGADSSWLLQMIGLNALITVIGWGVISWEGHLGGFIGGAAVTGVLLLVPRVRARVRLQWLGITVVALLVVVAYAVAIMMKS